MKTRLQVPSFQALELFKNSSDFHVRLHIKCSIGEHRYTFSLLSLLYNLVSLSVCNCLIQNYIVLRMNAKLNCLTNTFLHANNNSTVDTKLHCVTHEYKTHLFDTKLHCVTHEYKTTLYYT